MSSPTENQLACVRLFAAGKSYKQVAYDLNIPVGTVHDRIEAVKKKTGVNKMTALVALAVRQRWID